MPSRMRSGVADRLHVAVPVTCEEVERDANLEGGCLTRRRVAPLVVFHEARAPKHLRHVLEVARCGPELLAVRLLIAMQHVPVERAGLPATVGACHHTPLGLVEPPLPSRHHSRNHQHLLTPPAALSGLLLKLPPSSLSLALLLLRSEPEQNG